MSTDRSPLAGKTALVTGGAGFLGRQWVAALGEAGAKVISVDLAAPGSQDEEDGRVLHEQVDISDSRAVTSLARGSPPVA